MGFLGEAGHQNPPVPRLAQSLGFSGLGFGASMSFFLASGEFVVAVPYSYKTSKVGIVDFA